MAGEIDVTGDPLLVPTEQDTTTHTSGSSGHVMSKASKAAIDAEYAANQAVADAQKKVGEAQAVQNQAAADNAARANEEAHFQAAEAAAQQQEYADRIAQAREAAAAAEEQFANHKFHDYFRGNTAKQLASAFPLFIGGAGAAYLGNQNPAAEALQRRMDQDFAQQKAELDQQREVARMKGADVNDLFTQEQHENAALAVKHAKANQATAAALLEAMTAAGVPLEQAKNDVTVQGLLARAEASKREALAHYDRIIQGSTTQKTVEGAGAGGIAAQRLALQKQKLILRDPETGEPLGMMPTAEGVAKEGEQLSKLGMYKDAVNAFAAHIEQHGHLLNPLSDEYKERESLAANVQSLGRGIKGIQASDAGQKLEHQIIGGAGTGLGRTADPKVLRQLAEEATTGVRRKLKASLTPLPGEADSRPASGTAPARAVAAPEKPPRSDLIRMLQARSKGDRRFDDILRANGMIR